MHLKSKLQIRIKEKVIEKVIGKVEEKEIFTRNKNAKRICNIAHTNLDSFSNALSPEAEFTNILTQLFS